VARSGLVSGALTKGDLEPLVAKIAHDTFSQKIGIALAGWVEVAQFLRGETGLRKLVAQPQLGKYRAVNESGRDVAAN
jgi:hypothetical protein